MSNYDKEELDKFAAMAAHWWDPEGDVKTLHQINPLRMGYIAAHVAVANKSVLDIGCGGGILTESLSKAGATVTGIDLNPALIEVAKLHTLESQVAVDYQVISAEDFALTHAGQFDVITCLEMLEHVPDPLSILSACSSLLKPDGHLFLSTINRNPKAYLFAIVGAEYVLKLLPKNTHDYAKFIKPSELNKWTRQSNLNIKEFKGLTYNPFNKNFKLSSDISVNYLCYARK